MSFPLDEVVVGLTDYLLALECGLFAWWLSSRRSFAAFFGLTALASVAGGTSHLFFPTATTLAADVFWKLTLVSLGGVALAAWCIGFSLVCAQPLRRRLMQVAAAQFLVYAVYVVFIDDRFRVAIANYTPAAAFLALAFAIRYWRDRQTAILLGLAGLGLTALAAVVQRAGAALHPLYFNHNATYHLVQGIAFFLMFIAARSLRQEEA